MGAYAGVGLAVGLSQIAVPGLGPHHAGACIPIAPEDVMRTSQLALMLALAAAGCASSPPESPEPMRPGPARLEPVGTYDYSTTFEGTDVNGSIVINRAGDGYEGVINTGGMTDPIPVDRVIVEGQTLRVLADTPDGTLEFRLDFTGNEFAGMWTLADGSGRITGQRR